MAVNQLICNFCLPTCHLQCPRHAWLTYADFSGLQVRKEEADEVRKMLEAFRDDVNEEKVLRRLSRKRAASEG